jgi:hypothetical protein
VIVSVNELVKQIVKESKKQGLKEPEKQIVKQSEKQVMSFPPFRFVNNSLKEVQQCQIGNNSMKELPTSLVIQLDYATELDQDQNNYDIYNEHPRLSRN